MRLIFVLSAQRVPEREKVRERESIKEGWGGKEKEWWSLGSSIDRYHPGWKHCNSRHKLYPPTWHVAPKHIMTLRSWRRRFSSFYHFLLLSLFCPLHWNKNCSELWKWPDICLNYFYYFFMSSVFFLRPCNLVYRHPTVRTDTADTANVLLWPSEGRTNVSTFIV